MTKTRQSQRVSGTPRSIPSRIDFGDIFYIWIESEVEAPMLRILSRVQDTLNVAKVSCVCMYVHTVGLGTGCDMWW